MCDGWKFLVRAKSFGGNSCFDKLHRSNSPFDFDGNICICWPIVWQTDEVPATTNKSNEKKRFKEKMPSESLRWDEMELGQPHKLLTLLALLSPLTLVFNRFGARMLLRWLVLSFFQDSESCCHLEEGAQQRPKKWELIWLSKRVNKENWDTKFP